MTNVVELNRGKPVEATAAEVLTMAGRQSWDHCVVIGRGPDGFEVVTSYATVGDSLVALEVAKRILMELVHDQGR